MARVLLRRLANFGGRVVLLGEIGRSRPLRGPFLETIHEAAERSGPAGPGSWSSGPALLFGLCPRGLFRACSCVFTVLFLPCALLPTPIFAFLRFHLVRFHVRHGGFPPSSSGAPLELGPCRRLAGAVQKPPRREGNRLVVGVMLAVSAHLFDCPPLVFTCLFGLLRRSAGQIMVQAVGSRLRQVLVYACGLRALRSFSCYKRDLVSSVSSVLLVRCKSSVMSFSTQSRPAPPA